MDTPRIRTSHAYGEVYPNVFDDFQWVGEHRNDLLERYGECVMLVYQQQVVGTGKTLQEAIECAERDLPPAIGQITPIIYYLARRHNFFRVRPTASEHDG